MPVSTTLKSMASVRESGNGSVGSAVVLDNEPIGEPELPVLRILAFAKSLQRSAKNTVLTIQDRSSITVVAADGALEGSQASGVVLEWVRIVDL